MKILLQNSEVGHFVVFEQGKTVTFLRIAAKSDKLLYLEEVSIPASRFAKLATSSREWYENGAPGHSSWTLSLIDLDRATLVKTYSYDRAEWRHGGALNPFFTTLFNMPFEELALEKRKRVGRAGGSERGLWQPPLVVDGHPQPAVFFGVYTARWPKDGSELAGKRIEIYLPLAGEGEPPIYPTFFPYFLEVEGKITGCRLRAIDCGKELVKPLPTLY